MCRFRIPDVRMCTCRPQPGRPSAVDQVSATGPLIGASCGIRSNRVANIMGGAAIWNTSSVSTVDR